MIGAVIIVVVLLVVLPVGFIVGGGVLAAIFGWSLHDTARRDRADSELVDLNT